LPKILRALESMDVAIIVNPNNPDGRRVPAADLHALATALAHGAACSSPMKLSEF